MVWFFPSVWSDVGGDAIKSPYGGIFGLEFDFWGVVATISKTITNIFSIVINQNFFIIQKYFNTS